MKTYINISDLINDIDPDREKLIHMVPHKFRLVKERLDRLRPAYPQLLLPSTNFLTLGHYLIVAPISSGSMDRLEEAARTLVVALRQLNTTQVQLCGRATTLANAVPCIFALRPDGRCVQTWHGSS